MRNEKMLTAVLLTIGALFGITGCKSIPKGLNAVKPFQSDKYLGKWYEIARFDYHFERDLNNVTATYSLKPDGKIKVENQGYDTKKNKWKKSIGKAKFKSSKEEAKLLVSFFGPFYSGYNVIEIDEGYQYALVCGKNRGYLWILSRKPEMPADIKKRYTAKAKELKFDTDKLIWVEHTVERISNE